MFPLQQSAELISEILSNPCQRGEISQDLMIDYASPSTWTTIHHQLNHVSKTNPRKKRLPRRVLGRNNSDEITVAVAGADDLKFKKIMHRDMERQRRQEMASLYSSLRSLIPLQYVKGKRSVSDHMHEAVKYIKQLQENMNELEKKRDKLRIVSGCGKVEDGSSDSSMINVSQDCHVTVSPCQGGVEVLISANFAKGKNLPPSRVMQELLKQGLDVVSCVSTNVDQNSLHKIQSQVCDMKCVNLHALQRKLTDVINIDLE